MNQSCQVSLPAIRPTDCIPIASIPRVRPSPRTMRLRHLQLPHSWPALYPPYSLASRVQEHLRRSQLDFKDAGAAATAATPPQPPLGVTAEARLPQSRPPPPALLSFTPLPTYTLGRRQTAPLTDLEASRLRAPLHMPDGGGTTLPVTVVHSPRGGLVTYHGPGQTVLWPVLDLKSSHHKQFTVRCYSRLLEDTTIATLRSLFELTAFTTDDPGVWVHPQVFPSQAAKDVAKIAALGVHLRRHVSALGTAINVAMPGPDVVSEEMNPWARIVACGLEGKTVTSAAAEVAGGISSLRRRLGDSQNKESAVAAAWAKELAWRIGVDGVDTASQHDVVVLVTDVLSKSPDATTEETEYVKSLCRLL